MQSVRGWCRLIGEDGGCRVGERERVALGVAAFFFSL